MYSLGRDGMNSATASETQCPPVQTSFRSKSQLTRSSHSRMSRHPVVLSTISCCGKMLISTNTQSVERLYLEIPGYTSLHVKRFKDTVSRYTPALSALRKRSVTCCSVISSLKNTTKSAPVLSTVTSSSVRASSMFLIQRRDFWRYFCEVELQEVHST
jgi:hypothetical protein